MFATLDDLAAGEVRNPHPEMPVPEAVKQSAKPAAVLIGIVPRAEPTVLVTRRPGHIRFGGHICFPGGKMDADDRDEVSTALREAEEEIGLAPTGVEVLGTLGHYFTQSGYRIRPVVGLISDTSGIKANPSEVEEIIEISLARMFYRDAYQLAWRSADRGHLSYHEGTTRIAGPTVSMMIGLFERLHQAHQKD